MAQIPIRKEYRPYTKALYVRHVNISTALFPISLRTKEVYGFDEA